MELPRVLAGSVLSWKKQKRQIYHPENSETIFDFQCLVGKQSLKTADSEVCGGAWIEYFSVIFALFTDYSHPVKKTR